MGLAVGRGYEYMKIKQYSRRELEIYSRNANNIMQGLTENIHTYICMFVTAKSNDLKFFMIARCAEVRWLQRLRASELHERRLSVTPTHAQKNY